MQLLTIYVLEHFNNHLDHCMLKFQVTHIYIEQRAVQSLLNLYVFVLLMDHLPHI